jgi:hypothetical protein
VFIPLNARETLMDSRHALGLQIRGYTFYEVNNR